MLKKFNNLSIPARLILVQSTVMVALFTCSIAWMSAWLSGVMLKEQHATSEQLNVQMLGMVEIFENALTDQIERIADILKAQLPDNYSLNGTERIDVAGLSTPALRSGGELLNNNAAIVDRFTQMSRAVATVFARDGDNFVRVTTSLKKQDGSRAHGTPLDYNAPARTKLLANQSFTGKAQLFGYDYITAYTPITDKSGAVVGALFVGLNFTDELKDLSDRLKEVKIGQSGYAYVISSSPSNAGTYIVHPTLTGKNPLTENGGG